MTHMTRMLIEERTAVVERRAHRTPLDTIEKRTKNRAGILAKRMELRKTAGDRGRRQGTAEGTEGSGGSKGRGRGEWAGRGARRSGGAAAVVTGLRSER